MKGTALCRKLSAFSSPPISTKYRLLPERDDDASRAAVLTVSDLPFALAIYDDAERLSVAWDELAGDNLFLKRAFLQALQNSPPPGVSFLYVAFLDPSDTMVGIAYLQLTDFDTFRHINWESVQAWTRPLQQQLAKRLRFRLLVCGNLLLTGRHGFAFAPSLTPTGDWLHLALEALADHLAEENRPVQSFMVKDLPQEDPFGAALIDRGYHPAPFQPNMVMELDPAWKDFEDYLDSLTSKYRVRARRAFKMAESLELKDMQLREIVESEAELHRLYRFIADGADFNLVFLHRSYFTQLKTKLGTDFSLLGYFRDNRLLGFFTLIRNGRDLEAHFLGYEEEDNRAYQLYLNMLFEIIRRGIWMGCRRIIFSRTAMTIKSSVGATPKVMQAFIRHENPLFNRFVPGLIDLLEPEANWQQRHPFGR
ncbi:MAG: GNAT family N-acetyltransferase [Saprospiraceae bacterium]|nr:GNAT family N-acetyltransferase [Saprospiraceae bacterium]